jgi:hypothetical protein
MKMMSFSLARTPITAKGYTHYIVKKIAVIYAACTCILVLNLEVTVLPQPKEYLVEGLEFCVINSIFG